MMVQYKRALSSSACYIVVADRQSASVPIEESCLTLEVMGRCYLFVTLCAGANPVTSGITLLLFSAIILLYSKYLYRRC